MRKAHWHIGVVTCLVAGGLGWWPNTPASADEKGEEIHVRAIILGFKVEQETWDDALQRDGKGDEVYVEAVVSVRGPDNKELLPNVTRKSKVMGDTNDQKGRVQAGSRSNKGGLKTGDLFPHAAPWKRQGDPKSDELPMLVFDGKLKKGGSAVVVVPSILEWDGAGDFLVGWGDALAKVAEQALPLFAGGGGEKKNLVAEAGQAFATSATPAADLTRYAKAIPVAWDALKSIVGKAGDRPIGIAENDKKELAYTPPVFCLTYESVTKALEVDFGRGPGVLELKFRDADKLGSGHYQLFIQLEIVKK